MRRFKNFLNGKRVDSTSPPPYLLGFRSSKLFILSTICVAVFTDIFLYGIIVPVLPFALSERAGVAESSVQSWIAVLLAVYGAALLVCSPFAGWYADRSSSRRVPLLIGLLMLAGATVLLCLARSVALLVLGRLLQGFSAAIVWTVGQALLVDTVGQKEIGETLGYVSLSMSIGILLAPLLGGIVYNGAGYYAVYYIAFGLIALDICLRLGLIEKKIARQWEVDYVEYSRPTSDDGRINEQKKIEKAGESTQPAQDGSDPSSLDEKPIPSDPSQILSTSEEERQARSPPPVSSRLSRYPPVLTLLKSRRLLTALWGIMIQGALMTAFDSVLPLFVQETFGWDSIGAGLVFLAIFIPSFLSPLIGWASDRYGPRWLTVAGFLFAIPFWILLRLVTHNSLGQKVTLNVLLALIGVALALVMPPLMAEITYVVEAKEKETPGRYGSQGAYAQAYGLFVMAFAAGTLIGPIWAGYVRNEAGWGTMTWSLGLLSLAGALPCVIWTGGLITRNNAKTGDERAIGGPIAPNRANVDVV
ncbi:putative MFS-type transporter [Hyphodiscus hymeniophilus]|uniref:MFS-type transporter n=1 Tax=Hyphodiscus hymeniophilus TaxID=353542 RepID=A0A9P6VQT3_9HELO|nr:putative MFS-type transporter [Hyphodiscus hymeniophilus]